MDGEQRAQQPPPECSSQVLLCGEFLLAPSLTSEYALSLTATELHLQRLRGSPGDSVTVLRLIDVLGCRAFTINRTDPGGYFTLTAYPPKKPWWGSTASRQKLSKTFRAGGSQDPAENQRMAETWANKISDLSIPSDPRQESGAFSVLPRPSQVLIFLNPRGGKGAALSLFTTHVLPMLSKANIDFNLIVTERPNQARELARDEPLERWDALLVMSGDGLMYEVVNGLMDRPDWQSAIKKPLGILPAGSGNALAASINHYSGHEHVMNPELLINCSFHLCKGLVSPMDLVSITTGSGKRIFSFLSVSWGFVSDVDIESEKYRMLGAARFSIGTLIRLTALRTYKGHLSYLPAGGSNDQAPRLTSDQLSSTLSNSGTTSPAAHTSQNTRYNSCNSNNVGKVEAGGVPRSGSDVPELQDSLLVPLDQPVPNSWTVVKEEDFVLVLVLYQSHLGTDLFCAPMVTGLNNNLLHLFYVKAGIPRTSLLKLFMAMEKGTHLQHSSPHLVHIPIKAFRIEPFGSSDIMTVDGEVIDCGPVQGQVHSGLGRLISGLKEG